MSRKATPPDVRFWPKVAQVGNVCECWIWTAGVNSDGYGKFAVNSGSWQRAYRYSFEQVNGPVQNGVELDHLCRDRRCVNPYHLEAVPDRVNTLRGEGPTAENARKTHCPDGHPYDSFGSQRRCKTCAAKYQRKWKAKQAPAIERTPGEEG